MDIPSIFFENKTIRVFVVTDDYYFFYGMKSLVNYTSYSTNLHLTMISNHETSKFEHVEILRTAVFQREFFNINKDNIVKSILFELSHESAITTLSKRESKIHELLKLKLSDHKIAQLLNVSIKTVNTHRYNICNKLGFRNKIHLYNDFLSKSKKATFVLVR